MPLAHKPLVAIMLPPTLILSATRSLLIVVVPVLAPMLTVVAAPNAFTVVAIVLNTF